MVLSVSIAVVGRYVFRSTPAWSEELALRYTDFTELSTPMLNEFIEKVIVHEATGDRAHRKQKMDIYFNFIGNFVSPKQESNAPTLTKNGNKTVCVCSV